MAKRKTTVERKAEWVEHEGIEQARMWLNRKDPGAAQMAVAVLASTAVRIEALLAKPEPPVIERTPAEEVATWYDDSSN